MDIAKTRTFRSSAGFGKRIEFWIIGKMLKEGLDVYVPLVDDNAIDAIIRRSDGTFVEVQIKARSDDCRSGHGALYAGISHQSRSNYWFVFYSERLEQMWIMTSEEFMAESSLGKTGKHAGARTIWFNGRRKKKDGDGHEEYAHARYSDYQALNFDRIAHCVGVT